MQYIQFTGNLTDGKLQYIPDESEDAYLEKGKVSQDLVNELNLEEKIFTDDHYNTGNGYATKKYYSYITTISKLASLGWELAFAFPVGDVSQETGVLYPMYVFKKA